MRGSQDSPGLLGVSGFGLLGSTLSLPPCPAALEAAMKVVQNFGQLVESPNEVTLTPGYCQLEIDRQRP